MAPRPRPAMTSPASRIAGLALAALLLAASPLAGAQETNAVALPTTDLRWSAFLPLGDADGDGRDDVAFLFEQWSGRDLHRGAIGLADAGSRQLWRIDTDDAIGWVPDLDGNGINDLVKADSSGGGTATGQGTPVGSLYTGSFAQDGPARVLDGRSLDDVGVLPYGQSASSTTAFVYPVVAYAVAYDQAGSSTSSAVVAPGQVFSQDIRVRSDIAYAGAVVSGAMVYLQDRDATFTTHRSDGGIQARLDVTGPTLEPVNAVAGRFDGGPSYGVAAAWWETVPYAYVSQGGTVPQLPVATHVAVAMGDGAMWTLERPIQPAPRVTLATVVLPLPDIDGDGADDLQYVEQRLDLSGPVPSFGVETLLLSGRTGEVLRSEALTDEAAIYYAFGEDDRPGRLLRLTIDLLDGQTDWAVLDRYDAQPAWSSGIGSGYPANAAFAPAGQPRFTDVSGDGLNDLVLAEWDGDDLSLEARDGRDGAILWTAHVADAYGVRAVSAAGRTDLVALTATGHRQQGSPPEATAGFAVLDGATGRTLWSQVLRSPETRPVDSEGYFYLWATEMGDVDGDRAPDFAVSIERRVSRSMEGYESFYYETTSYLFGSSAAAPLASSASEPEGAEGHVAGGLPPAVRFTPDEASGDGKDAGGLGAFALLAAVAALAVTRRR